MSPLPQTKEALLQTAKPETMAHGDGFSWLTGVGFVFLTLNSVLAVYRSDGDPAAVAFVVVSYLDLVLLFLCLRLYETAPKESARRQWLKFFIWLLTTVLTFMFSQKVAALVPLPVAVVVWLMAALTIGGGFYAFFLYTDAAAEESPK